MGFSRPRYNEKARSHSRRSNEGNLAAKDGSPSSKSRPSKKQRRFDAYVAKKLKKDTHNQLLRDLEKSQSTIKDPSALISTAQLNSLSVPKSQKQIREIAANIEARKRDKAQAIISRKRKYKGYHSSDDGSDSNGSQKSIQPAVANTFSGAVTVVKSDVEPSDQLSKSLAGLKPRAEEPPYKPVLGSALAPGAVTIIKINRKPNPTIGPRRGATARSEDDSFDSSDSDSDDDLDSPSFSKDGNLRDEEEWKGCQLNSEEEDSLLCEAPVSDLPPAPQRVKGRFRDWANAQLLKMDQNSDETSPGQPTPPIPPTSVNVKHSPTKRGPLGIACDLPSTDLFTHQKTTHVPLTRTDAIMSSRSLLPIFAEEHTVMDAIRRHPVVVICGETGSGKTTQLPQFLYEAGWGEPGSDNPGMIGITQPRRVAAVSMARRVEDEMGLKGKGVVGHQIRYEATTGSATRVKFMTDGVLLRELAVDFLLTKYSVVVVDEAHERSVNTDVLIGVLSRIVRLRLKMWRDHLANAKNSKAGPSPLRLIIMSATLRVTDFTLNTTLFSEPPPVITIGARQFPVAIHFSRKTNGDYVSEAYKKAIKIHTRLPPGGILIFLTGQLEIITLCKKLARKYGRAAIEERTRHKLTSLAKLEFRKKTDGKVDSQLASELELPANSPSDANVEAEEIQLGNEAHDLAVDVDEGQEPEEDLEALETEDEDGLEGSEGFDLLGDSDAPMYILPLYSLLPTEEQMKVFEDPPADSRMVIIATNVAETSLTIPNIRYVIDSGRAKERHYDLASGIQSFDIDWISKASASQRAGRAGRTGPGHCYRLYSSAVFENYFEEYSKPEIQRMPIDGIVLQMKAMNIDTVTNFPFPTPPDRFALRKAEVSLAYLGALAFNKEQNSWPSNGEKANEASITDMGRVMARYPLTPRFARMLVSGHQHGCLPYVIALVSILSVGDPFLHDDVIDADSGADLFDTPVGDELGMINSEDVKAQEVRKAKRKQFFMVQQKYAKLGGCVSDLFKTLAVVGAFEFDRSGRLSQFCNENFVRVKAMEEIHKLRCQITRIVQCTASAEAGVVEFSPDLRPPSDLQLKVLRQLITASFIDQVAVKSNILPKSSFDAQATKGSKKDLVSYRAIGVKEDVFIHPSSILFTSSLTASPDFVVFQELHRTRNRLWIKGITKVNPAWLPVIGKSLCTFSKPLEGAVAKKDLKEDERVCHVVPRFGGPGLDVELAPIEATQKRVGTRWVWV